MTQRVPKKFYLVPRSLMYVNVCIKCVRDMDWKSSVNLGTHCHHYSFLASTLKLDSSQQGARWEVVQQRQRNAPRSSSVLDGCRPELLKPRNVLCKSERERESCPNRKNLQHYDLNTLYQFLRIFFSCIQSQLLERRFGTVSNVKTPAVHSITFPFSLQYLRNKCCLFLNVYPRVYPKEYNDS